DSRETLSGDEAYGDQVTNPECVKLFRFLMGSPKETIAATYGTSTPGLVALDWLERSLPLKRPLRAPTFESSDDFGLVVLNRQGLWVYDRFLRPERLTREFHAFGSGAKAAL